MLFLSASSAVALADGSAYLGVVLGKLPEGVPVSKGAFVQEIFENSPADRDGLRTGDLILALNDQEIMDAQGLLDVIKFLKSGDKARFKIQRAGDKKLQELTITLVDRRGQPLAELPLKKRPSLGIAFSLQADGRLSVAQFLPNSVAEQSGFKMGDVTATIAGHEAKDYLSVLSLLAAQKDGEEVKIQVLRDNQTHDLSLKVKVVTPQYNRKP